MAKLRPAKGKGRKAQRAAPQGVSCIILVVAGLALVMFFLYFVMKNANG